MNRACFSVVFCGGSWSFVVFCVLMCSYVFFVLNVFGNIRCEYEQYRSIKAKAPFFFRCKAVVSPFPWYLTRACVCVR